MRILMGRVFQFLLVLVGVGAVVFLLAEPHFEGRNAQATLVEIYFKDPFLAFAYVASIPFFVALVQAFKLIGYAGQNSLSSPIALKRLRTIKYCAILIIVSVVIGEIFIMRNISDDRAGGVVMGIVIAFGATAVGAGAARLERKFHGHSLKT
jgi:hypothetical protein